MRDGWRGEMAHIYAIGDIHGCHAKLRRLLKRIDIDWSRDRLVFLGDYIDRGPAAYAVVECLIDIRRRYPQTVFLKGNHEAMLLDYLSGIRPMVFLANGGRRTLESYTVRRQAPFPKEHLDFFASLVLFHEAGEYVFVHAGVRPGVALTDQQAADLLWIREPFIGARNPAGPGRCVVFGHTPFDAPLIRPDKIGIDTGAVYGRRLTCVRLPDITFYSV